MNRKIVTMFHALGAAASAAILLSGVVLAQQAQPPVGEGSQRISAAKPGEIRLMVTDGLRVPLEKVRADIEKAVGHKLVVQYSESHVLQKEMEGGQPFELALVTQDVVDSGIAKGVMLPDKTVVARIRVGVFQRGDAPLQDVSSPDALKKALLGAASVRWSANAAAEPTVLNTFKTLGVADTLKPKMHPTTMGQANQPIELKAGEYELVINIIGETVRPPLILLGEIPKTLQIPIVLPAGIGAKGDVAAARAVVKFLMSPAFTPALEASKLMR
jgi:molybdate transport system substrate-binding protein